MTFKVDGWTLYQLEVVTRNMGRQTIYFFSKRQPKRGDPASALPGGYEVVTNTVTGLPCLRKIRTE